VLASTARAAHCRVSAHCLSIPRSRPSRLQSGAVSLDGLLASCAQFGLHDSTAVPTRELLAACLEAMRAAAAGTAEVRAVVEGSGLSLKELAGSAGAGMAAPLRERASGARPDPDSVRPFAAQPRGV
jgi:hypothetical protein